MMGLTLQFLKEQQRGNDLQPKVIDMVIQNVKECLVDHRKTNHGTVRKMAVLCCIGNQK